MLVGDEDGTTYVKQYDWTAFSNEKKFGTVSEDMKGTLFQNHSI